MLKNKLKRHSFTFFLFALASSLLFPATMIINTSLIWVLLAIIILANLINLVIKG